MTRSELRKTKITEEVLERFGFVRIMKGKRWKFQDLIALDFDNFNFRPLLGRKIAVGKMIFLPVHLAIPIKKDKELLENLEDFCDFLYWEITDDLYSELEELDKIFFFQRLKEFAGDLTP